jgi:sulfur-carrier protein
MIRVVVPVHLRTLAGVSGELKLDLGDRPTQRALLDAIEAAYPMLRGTIRDQVTQRRRNLLRFFACGLDLSNEPPDAPLPAPVTAGTEIFFIVGAIAGG